MSTIEALRKQCSGLQPLGQGGQKQVWSGVHPAHGPIVLKVGTYKSLASLERISREVNVLRQIDSPYYPKNYDFAFDPTTQQFATIEERLDAVELSVVAGSFRSDDALLSLLRSLVEGLTIIWERRIVHRDLKPANILIDTNGAPKIIDLGIARFLDQQSLTATVLAAGPHTPIYAAPEQLTNTKAMIDPRTDFFLLGIVALELHLGFHPFDPKHVGNQVGIVDNLVTAVYHPPRSCHWQLAGFIDGALKRRPVKRFRTPKELSEFLL